MTHPLFEKYIDLDQPEQVDFWANLFDCSHRDITIAVLNVGKSAVSVEAYLCMNRISNTIFGSLEDEEN